ncbi:MAG: hypothetical protein AAF557_28480 [Pseudomonadota bacterium]
MFKISLFAAAAAILLACAPIKTRAPVPVILPDEAVTPGGNIEILTETGGGASAEGSATGRATGSDVVIVDDRPEGAEVDEDEITSAGTASTKIVNDLLVIFGKK